MKEPTTWTFRRDFNGSPELVVVVGELTQVIVLGPLLDKSVLWLVNEVSRVESELRKQNNNAKTP